MKCEHCGHDQASGKFCDKCGHSQKTGRICDKCGVMLDFYQALPEEDEVSARCPECGSNSTQPQCRNCGIMIPNFPGQEE